MHGNDVHAEVTAFAHRRFNDCEIARRVGIPLSTVRDMRRRGPAQGLICPRCWCAAKPMAFTAERYAHLLGLYLGDGCISRLGRTYSLRLSLDAKYPGIVAEARSLLETCFTMNRVCQHAAGERRTTMVLCLYNNHLPCVFPQHGAGQKQLRRIALEPWQQELVASAPWSLIRGLIQSDGCRFINRTGRYVYPSYDFTQVSDDIRRIFTDACDLVGVGYRAYPRRVRIYRRPSVALMDTHVGDKA